MEGFFNLSIVFIFNLLILESVKFVQSAIAWLMFFFPDLKFNPHAIKAFEIIAEIALVLKELQNLCAGFLAILTTTTPNTECIRIF